MINIISQLNQTGILWMMGWCLSFTITMSIAKYISHEAPVVMIVFMRCLFGFIILLPLIYKKGIEIYHTQQLKWHLFRILCACFAIGCTYTAYTRLPLSFATSIGFTSPMMVALLSMIALKDYLTGKQWLALFLGYCGVLIMTDPQANGDYTGMLIALGANLFAAMAMLTVKKLTKTEDALTIMVYSATGILLVSSIVASMYWQPLSLRANLCLCMMGIIATSSQWLYIQAMRIGRPALLASFEYSRLVLAIPLGIWFFGESISATLLLGSVFIIASNAYMARTST